MKKSYFLFICTVTMLFLNCKNDDGSLPVDDTPEDVIENLETDILDFSPALGAWGTLVTIRGENFDLEPEGNEVQFNGMLAEVESASESTLVVIVPEDATTGKISLSANGYDYTSFQDFTVLLPPPIVSDFGPKTGVEGDEVTITGDHFGEGNYVVKVYFEGSNIPAEVLSITDTQIIVKVPDANSGELRVVVQSQESISDDEFTYMSWRQLKDFEFEPRRFAATWAVGKDFYIGLGLGYSKVFTDFFKYDSTTKVWTKMPDFPSNGRYSTFHFAIDDVLYVGAGKYSDAEFFSFNLNTNGWAQLNDFPGIAPEFEREGATAFVIDGKAYVYGGWNFANDTKYNDLWEYDPENDTWTEKSGFEELGRAAAVAFSIGNKGYIATGIDSNSNRLNDIWEYDPASDTWTEKEPMPPGLERYGAIGFATQSKGYVGMGLDNNYDPLNDMWRFDPAAKGGNGSWTGVSDFPAQERKFPLALSNGEQVLVGLGWFGVDEGYPSDLLEYVPKHDE